MSILSALERAYDRLPGLPPPGYAMVGIRYAIPLSPDGTPGLPIDLRPPSAKGARDAQRQVPQPPKRAAGIAPVFLWDKTAYALGVTAKELDQKQRERRQKEHAAFVDLHLRELEDSPDEGLKALVAFLKQWEPEQFEQLGWPEDIKDANVVFTLDSDWRERALLLHDRPAARDVWQRVRAQNAEGSEIRCLVTGRLGPLAKLHPSIKGVWGAQSAGASIVSFNLAAFESYGHKQGENAPLEREAAFKYTTVLNHLLARGSAHRVQLGDASCVFWAEAEDPAQASTAASVAAEIFGTPASDDSGDDASEVASILARLAAGVPVRDAAPQLASGVRFYVLGLAPNAARLSIRFWFEDSFGVLLERWQRLWMNLRVEPPDPDPVPALWKYLREVAVLRKTENIPPRLAGDWFEAVLHGHRYPQTLMALTLMRMRADGRVDDARRVAMLRAVLVRNHNLAKEAPVALDPDNINRGYRLGRLFAIYEEIQRAALGGSVNATIKDKYYGAASARPLGIFPVLDRGAAHHLSKIGKASPGRRVNLEKLLGSVLNTISPDEQPYPPILPLADQALFALGYYHQRNSFFADKSTAASDAPQGPEETK